MEDEAPCVTQSLRVQIRTISPYFDVFRKLLCCIKKDVLLDLIV